VCVLNVESNTITDTIAANNRIANTKTTTTGSLNYYCEPCERNSCFFLTHFCAAADADQRATAHTSSTNTRATNTYTTNACSTDTCSTDTNSSNSNSSNSNSSNSTASHAAANNATTNIVRHDVALCVC
jgi:hypothetical protein